MDLKDFRIYNIAVKIADKCWSVYSKMDWREKKIIGDQWIRSVDSVAANIAEGHGRYHYLDKCRFFYNARGSLYESLHWTETLFKREKIDEETKNLLINEINDLGVRLNNTISVTYKKKKGEDS